MTGYRTGNEREDVSLEIRFDAAGVVFEGRQVLQPLSLTLTERRIGVIGLNGSGKTTFARLINGLNKPKLRIDRNTGIITIAGGFCDLTGQCELASTDPEKRKF